MRRFFRKKLRHLSKAKVKPKKLGIISVFALAIFTAAIGRVFATSDATIEFIPQASSYTKLDEYDDPNIVKVTVKFNTNKTWDKVGIALEYDTDVFDVSETMFKKGVKEYDGSELTNGHSRIIENDSKFFFNAQSNPNEGMVNIVATTLGDNTLNCGLTLGTLWLTIRPDAPGGSTSITPLLTYNNNEQTYLGLEDDRYTLDTSAVSVTIEVPVESHGISPNSLSLDVNKNPSGTINITYSPLDTTTPKNFSFSSDDTGVCTVSQEGVVTAVSNGTCNITVNEFGSTHTVPVTVTAELISIDLDTDYVEINKTATHQFVPSTNPNPTSDTVTYQWATSDSSVATVSSTGLVTGEGGGTATITATAVVNGTPNPNIKKEATVRVIVPFTSASANPSTINLQRGIEGEESKTINVVFLPLDATQDPIVSWSSSDDTIVTVSNAGVVTGLKEGTATITGSVSGIPDFTVTVNVTVPILNFEVTPSTVELYPGQNQTLTAAIDPVDTSENDIVTWSSSNDNVATVTNGVVHAVATGTATITATTGDGNLKSDTVEVTVVQAITGVQLSETSFTLYTNNGNSNKIKTLTATINPAGAGTSADRVITWTTDDANVATVSGGVVTAVGNGVAHITATAGTGQNAQSDTATVTVKTKVTSFVLTNSNSVTLEVGTTHQINTSISPENASDKTISWNTNSSSIATVSSSGLITAQGNGTTTITGTCDGIQVTVTVRVITSATAIQITDGDITVNKGTVRTLQTQITPLTSSDTKSWTSDDATTVSVNPTSGEITALKAGSATITVTAGSVSDSIVVTVVVPATGIVITESDSITLNKGSNKILTKTVTPEDCTETISWSSSDDTKVSVNQNGKIVAEEITSSPVTITATVGGFSDSIEVTVILAATGVEIDQGNSINLEKDSTTTLTATITPTGSTDGVTWSSNHSNIASVDPSTGVVRGEATGTAIITATVGSVSDSITVEVVISATGVTINGPKPLSINVGEETTLTATVTPNGSTDSVTWSSNDTSKVTVTSSGVIRGIAKGSATITASAGNYSDTVTVNVLLPATSVTISGSSSITMNKGTSQTLSATVEPSGSSDSVVWSTSAPSIVSVNSSTGQISALATGNATITATAGTQTDTVNVTVESHATSVSINQGNSVNVNKGSTTTLTTTLQPNDCTDTVTWSSNKTGIATVNSSGVVTGVAPGSATITATAGTQTDTITVNVLSPATSVSINQGNSVNVNKGSTTTLTATVSPSDSTDSVVWSSDSTGIATVNSSTGVVTGVSKGTAIITATAGSRTDTITVNVLVPATSVSIANSGSGVTVARGTTTTLSASVLPSDSTDTVSWSSSNTGVATVNSSGVVTGVSKGTATITATAGSNNATITVTVNAPITAFTSSNQNVTVIKGQTSTLTYTITPSDTTDSKTITWTSNRTNIATVDSDGVVTGVAGGTATVTATLGSFQIQYAITVNTIDVTGISLNKDNFDLRKGDTETLTYSVIPSNATEATDPVWTSTNPSAATVDQHGVVTGIAEGTSIIRATMNGNIIDEATVSVYEVELTGIAISNSDNRIAIGDSLTIQIALTPSNATDDVTYTYESSDPDIATVDENGNISAVGYGVVTITVHCSNGLEDTMEFNIVERSSIINPNTGVKSVLFFIITGIGSILGIRFVSKKRTN